MSMAAGEFNRKVAVEKRLETVDELNQPVLGDWVHHKFLWVNVQGQTGMASIRGSAAEQGLPRDLNAYSFRSRFIADGSITSGMRIVHLGQRFDIKQLRHDFNRREWTDIICEAGAHND